MKFGLDDIGQRRFGGLGTFGEISASGYVGTPNGPSAPHGALIGVTPLGQPIYAPAPAAVVPGKALVQISKLPAATDQQSICASAARLTASGNPSAGSARQRCMALRQANIAQGLYISDELDPNDGTYRVALDAAGQRVIAANPTLAAARAALPDPDGTGGMRRGYTIAQGVRAGSLDAGFIQFVQRALSGPTLQGFNDAMAQPASLTQAGNGGDGGGFLDSIPRPVLIGGVALALAGIGFAVYKAKH